MKLSPDGGVLDRWYRPGRDPGQFLQPSGLALDAEGNVYVADAGNYRVQKFSPTGQPLAQWGKQGRGPGEFEGLRGIAVDAQGDLYVTDEIRRRVQKLSPAGQPLADWFEVFGSQAGQASAPSAVTVGAGGSVYVADQFGRVLLYTP